MIFVTNGVPYAREGNVETCEQCCSFRCPVLYVQIYCTYSNCSNSKIELSNGLNKNFIYILITPNVNAISKNVIDPIVPHPLKVINWFFHGHLGQSLVGSGLLVGDEYREVSQTVNDSSLFWSGHIVANDFHLS